MWGSPPTLNPVLWRRYWNDPEMLSKLGKAMGGTFDFPGLMGAAPGEEGAGAEAEGEEEGEEEETLHAAASAGQEGEGGGRRGGQGGGDSAHCSQSRRGGGGASQGGEARRVKLASTRTVPHAAPRIGQVGVQLPRGGIAGHQLARALSMLAEVLANFDRPSLPSVSIARRG